MYRSIDLNLDAGEIPLLQSNGQEVELMKCVSSVNIASGGHAGDESSMLFCAKWAKDLGLAVGAHPSYPDRIHFGRKSFSIGLPALKESVKSQLNSIADICEVVGAHFSYIKLHGALYNDVAKNAELAAFIGKTITEFCDLYPMPRLGIVTLAKSKSVEVLQNIGLKVAEEVFLDRAYLEDGNLVPRSQVGAVLDTEDQITNQLLELLKNRRIRTINGEWISVEADTLCIHGDGKDALKVANLARKILAENSVAICPVSFQMK